MNQHCKKVIPHQKFLLNMNMKLVEMAFITKEQHITSKETEIEKLLTYSSHLKIEYSVAARFFRNHPFFASNEIISVIKYWYQIKAVYDNEE
ncbi:hypothetical protein DXC33_14055 [Clostridiaceae bacterium TF01-6]|nr:hypothetical protein DXC33_14055 [Clostridiaceae bacterium TF01-6]